MSRVAYPFLTMASETVGGSGWLVSRAGADFEEIGDFLADWDYDTPVRIRRTILVHHTAASRDLELEPDDFALSVAVQVGTGPGMLPRLIVWQEQRDLKGAATVEIELPSSLLSSVLHLRTTIVLAQVPRRAGDLSPRNIGERLWSDQLRVRLEDKDPRFPIEVADFSALLGNSAAGFAPWYLHWSPRDWSRNFHGALRLYLNRKHEALVRKVEGEDPETLQHLMADVMGQVCEALLRDVDAEGVIERCEEGSLGRQAWYWLELAFPEHDLSRMKSVLDNRPGVFRAAFLAVAEQKEPES